MKGRTAVLWVLVLAGILALLYSFKSGSAKHNLVDDVPLGSKLSQLDAYLKRGVGSEGEVIQWTQAKGSEKNGAEPIVNDLGSFVSQPLGKYDDWKATTADRDRFTGEIRFFHSSVTSSDVNSFVYQDGVLRRKDWGFLPG